MLRKITWVVLVFLSSFLFADGSNKEAVCSGNNVNLRGVPSLNSDILDTLSKNDRVLVIKKNDRTSDADGKKDYWYKVKVIRSGKIGWIFGSYLQFSMEGGGLSVDRTIGRVTEQKINGMKVSAGGSVYLIHEGSVSLSSDGGNVWKSMTPAVLGQKIGEISDIKIAGAETILLGSSKDSGGGVWLTTNGGKSWNRFSRATGLPSDSVFSVTFHPGRISELFALTSEGVASSSNNGQEWKTLEGEFPDGDPMAIVAGKDGILWVAYEDGLAVKFPDTREFEVVESEEVELYSLTHLECDARGNLWAGGPEGLYYITIDKKVKHFPGSNVTDLAIQGNFIYVGTTGGVSYSSNSGESWANFGKSRGLLSDQVEALAIDFKRGMLWVATSSGLVRLKPE